MDNQLIATIGQEPNGLYVAMSDSRWAQCIALQKSGKLTMQPVYKGNKPGIGAHSGAVFRVKELPRLSADMFLERLRASSGGVFIESGTDEWTAAAELQAKGLVHVDVYGGYGRGKVTLAELDDLIYTPPPRVPGVLDLGGRVASFPVRPAPVPATRRDVVKAVQSITTQANGTPLYPALAGFILDVLNISDAAPERAVAALLFEDVLRHVTRQPESKTEGGENA